MLRQNEDVPVFHYLGPNKGIERHRKTITLHNLVEFRGIGGSS